MEPSVIQIRRSYKYRLYENKHIGYLGHLCNIAGLAWNVMVAEEREHFNSGGNYAELDLYAVTRDWRNDPDSEWRKDLYASCVQNAVRFRFDKSMKIFFKHPKAGRPRFVKVKKYPSFTLTYQRGWKLNQDNDKPYSNLKIGKHWFKFKTTRRIPESATIKTVTIKRDNQGHFWVTFSVIKDIEFDNTKFTGKAGGFDFGLKTFLVSSDGTEIQSPQYYKSSMKRLAKAQRRSSKHELNCAECSKIKLCDKGKRLRNQSARMSRSIANKRKDWQWKLANQITDEYDYIYFEDLNLEGMKRLWGRKVSDLALNSLIAKLKFLSEKKGKTFHQIGRFEPSSQLCSETGCDGRLRNLTLADRVFACPDCDVVNDRDLNAAINILNIGLLETGMSPGIALMSQELIVDSFTGSQTQNQLGNAKESSALAGRVCRGFGA